MKILLTGAFGNVGTSTLKELVKREHYTRCFDLPTKKNKRIAKKFKRFNDKIEIVWGDLTNYTDVEKAVEGVEVIIHLAAIIPPFANKHPEIAEPVNVGGTKNIITAAQQQPKPPKIIFSSSVAVYGDVREKGFDYVIKTTDDLKPSSHDFYARHKIKCEEMLKESGLTWLIFRFAAIPPFDLKLDPIMFDVPLDTPMELCHTLDTGFALANAVESTEVWGKILHIGGGEKCRVPYSEYVGRILDEMGIGRLPEEAFGIEPFHCGYMDTTKTEKLLHFQRRTFDDLLKDVKKRFQWLKPLIVLFRPAIRSYLLKQSKYYQAYVSSIKEYMYAKKRTKAKAKKAILKKTEDKTPTKTPSKTG